MTTETAPNTCWSFPAAAREAGLTDELEAIAEITYDTLKRLAACRDQLRKIYDRIARTAAAAVQHMDAGHEIYFKSEALGSDRDRLVALHAQYAALNGALHGHRHLINTTGYEIDPFDYLAV